MARNRIAMSRALFDRLIEHARQEGDPVAHPECGRFIQRYSESDAELMASGTAAAVIVTRQIRLVRIEHSDQLYFCTFGLPEPEELPSGLELMSATPGIFCLSVLMANLRPAKNITGARIKDALDDAHIDNHQGYKGHTLDEITPLFSPLLVYRADDRLQYQDITERVLGSILARTYLDGPISLEPETVTKFTEVFEQASALIPFRNLIQGLLSISWENLFLETYRCVEQLYALPRVERLKKVLPHAPSARDLAKILEDHLSWFPKEEESFRALFRLCEEHVVSAICTGLDGGIGETHDKRCDAAVRELYALRNRIVHYRPIHDTITKSDAEWNVIVRGMLNVVSFLYDTKGCAFFEASDSIASAGAALEA